MNVVLVSIGCFQEYILTNIKQLIRLGHKKIYVITNNDFFGSFSEYENDITLIDASLLNDTYEYCQKTDMNKNFRNAFWVHTSSRFFYIYAFMETYGIVDVIHLENDVPIYYHCDTLIPLLNKKYVYVPLDCYNRVIASIVYIPEACILKNILTHYEYNINDMENFAKIMKKIPECFETFPIAPLDCNDSEEQQVVSKKFNNFNMIFDAAAIGQFLGGVDPRNIPGDTTGFINETCVIKYDRYGFDWNIDNGIRKPFLIDYNGDKIPIFNLHILCKRLENFI